MKIFVYGTLMKRYGNHRLIENSKFLGKAVTNEKYGLYSSGIPYVCKTDKISQVFGEVYDVPEEDMPRVDGLEGHPRWYRREEIEATILETGENVTAWLYFMPSLDNNDKTKQNLTLIKTGNYHDVR